MTDQRLHVEFMRVARGAWARFAIADTTGVKLTYGRTLIAAFALGRLIERHTAGETTVGTLLPASAGAVIANLALCIAGRVPVNLNFTAGRDAIDTAVRQAGIRTILTSRRFLEKASLPPLPGMVYLEDLRSAVTAGDKLRAIISARLTPLDRLARRYGPSRDGRPGLATIVFSSGSTGRPKGVLLTHAAVLANVQSMARLFPMAPDDVFVGILPLFHSFGFTATMWFPLLQGAAVVYHPNPMDAKTIGEITEAYKATMLVSTPTFCSAYARRCTPEQFRTLRHLIVGAEKLREPLRNEFREKYGVELLEGYGCTEMAPVVAVNVPNDRPGGGERIGNKPGSVGRPLPDVEAKIVDPATGEDLGIDRDGLLLVRGPNMMAGYLDAPELTAEAIRDGWYVTGDIARIDADGFIFITDRLSRFSKIAGEMVPHLKVEDAVNGVLGDGISVVTGVADAARGERLVVFYSRPDIPPDTLWERLHATDLPRLWIPKREDLIPLDAVPTLGSGKVDLVRIKQLASELRDAGV